MTKNTSTERIKDFFVGSKILIKFDFKIIEDSKYNITFEIKPEINGVWVELRRLVDFSAWCHVPLDEIHIKY